MQSPKSSTFVSTPSHFTVEFTLSSPATTPTTPAAQDGYSSDNSDAMWANVMEQVSQARCLVLPPNGPVSFSTATLNTIHCLIGCEKEYCDNQLLGSLPDGNLLYVYFTNLPAPDNVVMPAVYGDYSSEKDDKYRFFSGFCVLASCSGCCLEELPGEWTVDNWRRLLTRTMMAHMPEDNKEPVRGASFSSATPPSLLESQDKEEPPRLDNVVVKTDDSETCCSDSMWANVMEEKDDQQQPPTRCFVVPVSGRPYAAKLDTDGIRSVLGGTLQCMSSLTKSRRYALLVNNDGIKLNLPINKRVTDATGCIPGLRGDIVIQGQTTAGTSEDISRKFSPSHWNRLISKMTTRQQTEHEDEDKDEYVRCLVVPPKGPVSFSTASLDTVHSIIGCERRYCENQHLGDLPDGNTLRVYFTNLPVGRDNQVMPAMCQEEQEGGHLFRGTCVLVSHGGWWFEELPKEWTVKNWRRLLDKAYSGQLNKLQEALRRWAADYAALVGKHNALITQLYVAQSQLKEKPQQGESGVMEE